MIQISENVGCKRFGKAGSSGPLRGNRVAKQRISGQSIKNPIYRLPTKAVGVDICGNVTVNATRLRAIKAYIGTHIECRERIYVCKERKIKFRPQHSLIARFLSRSKRMRTGAEEIFLRRIVRPIAMFAA